MFTGIIEALGVIETVESEGSNRHFSIRTTFREEDPIRVDQSISHDGVCLTVTQILQHAGNEYLYQVTAVEETLSKTQLGSWAAGRKVNVERCMRMGGRLDGHLVQGHVDTVGEIREIELREGSWLIRIGFPADFAELLVDRGSICVNGVSLTVVEAAQDSFTVTIIPFTWEHTDFHQLQVGDAVNLEFDILGKYLLRRQHLAATSPLAS
ncbi:MAG: riboflavin synthase [Bacteroidia bacterium]|nr:riboflavin synthase [Bacteroidia bacterium]